MNAVAPPIPLIPENAPFAPAQRAWLNGFLAGLYGGAAQPMSLAPPEVAEKVEDFPWHDPVLELPDRLTLAEGRALPQRLMAAMGQLDCGQCGYMCQTYAAALAEGRESSISLCVPGAKATQLALKRLMAEAPVPLPAPTAHAPIVPTGRDVRVLAVEPLTKPGSSKDVRHVAVDLLDSGLTYTPGDSLSIAVPNDPALVEATLAALGTNDGTVCAALTNDLDIARPLDRTLDLLAGAAVHPRHAAALRALSDGEAGAEPADADLLDLLQAFPSARPPIQDLLRSLTRAVAGCAMAWRAASSQTAPSPTDRSAPPSRPATSACQPIHAPTSSCADQALASHRFAPSCRSAQPAASRAAPGCCSASASARTTTSMRRS
jgi:sulfite reductase (NADPH) flavoprotein alpha-component